MPKPENIMQSYNYKKIFFFIFFKFKSSSFNKGFVAYKNFLIYKFFKKKKVCLFFMARFKGFFRFGIVYNKKLFYYRNIRSIKSKRKHDRYFSMRLKKHIIRKLLKLIMIRVKIFIKTYKIKMLIMGFKFKKMTYKKRLKKFHKLKTRLAKRKRGSFIR